jgi:beta-RFAP synthase
MSREVVVTTGARLHFGFFAHGQRGQRQFGGAGVMVDRPGFVVRTSCAAHDNLQCGSWTGRVEELLSRLRAAGPREFAGQSLRVEIASAPPAHAGLGSGTQLAMALAKAVTVLSSETDLTHTELARRAGRGRRSAIGLHGFRDGGLLVEAGKRAPEEISPLVARVEFPEEWRFILVRPRGATGISGTDESSEFCRLAPMSHELTANLCAVALTEILPAAIEHDFARASQSIGRFGRMVGEYFAPVQGGVIAHMQMRQLAESLQSRGIDGIGQSSWGPTLFVLCPNSAFAQDLAAELSTAPAAADCEITVAAPLNRGAIVKVN